MPQRHQRKREKGARLPDGVVYVGRPTRYGNMYRVEPDPETEDKWSVINNGVYAVRGLDSKCEAEAAAVRLFKQFLVFALLRDWDDKASFLALRGKDLACWCPLDKPCHADAILELVNE